MNHKFILSGDKGNQWYVCDVAEYEDHYAFSVLPLTGNISLNRVITFLLYKVQGIDANGKCVYLMKNNRESRPRFVLKNNLSFKNFKLEIEIQTGLLLSLYKF